MNNAKKKVVVGMSGGVDSSLTAALLIEQGYDVTGVFLECWRAPGCRVDEDRKDALDVAMRLGIPYKVLDFKAEYKDRVVEYFYEEYKAGRTPNPDAVCNREIKFGMFYKWAMENGFDYIATGHYARVATHQISLTGSQSGNLGGQAGHYARVEELKAKNEEVKTETKKLKLERDYVLASGVDVKKDQSYFLYQIKPEQLAHILFPLGEMTKVQVREEAKKRGLSTAAKPDSVGICFIGDINVRKFLEERIAPKKGDVVDTKGRVIGEHDGAWFYTIGQRNGFRVKQNLLDNDGKTIHMIPPFYVIQKDVKNNRLVVGFGEETLSDKFEVSEMNWLVPSFRDSIALLQNDEKFDVFVRIRHLGQLIKARVQIDHPSQNASEWRGSSDREKLSVVLEEPQRGVAPGQAAVFYDENGIVLGGGIIC